MRVGPTIFYRAAEYNVKTNASFVKISREMCLAASKVPATYCRTCFNNFDQTNRPTEYRARYGKRAVMACEGAPELANGMRRLKSARGNIYLRSNMCQG